MRLDLWMRRATWTRSKWGGSSGNGTRPITKRLRRTGKSKLLPLNVTSIDAARIRSATRASTGASSPSWRTSSCSTTSPRSSNHARPTRNATVPAPGPRPVVSVSRYKAPAGSQAARRGSRASNAHSSRDAERAIATGARPTRCAPERRSVRTWSGPSGVSSTQNGRSSASARGNGRGASERVRARMASMRARRSSSTLGARAASGAGDAGAVHEMGGAGALGGGLRRARRERNDITNTIHRFSLSRRGNGDQTFTAWIPRAPPHGHEDAHDRSDIVRFF